MIPVFWHGVRDSEPKRAVQCGCFPSFNLSARSTKCFAFEGLKSIHSNEKKERSTLWCFFPFFGRGDGIRTHDFYVPNVALYQTEPHLVMNFFARTGLGHATSTFRTAELARLRSYQTEPHLVMNFLHGRDWTHDFYVPNRRACEASLIPN